ncbi:MAG: hypothetical protein ACE5GE_00045 [Phycisphaerae bacterium]
MSESQQNPERRQSPEKRRQSTDRRRGLDRRRGPGRRRGDIRRDAEEGEMTGELYEFVMAIDEYKRVNNRPFPSFSEIFELVKYLGYRKVAEKADHINEPEQGDLKSEN